MSDLLQTSPYLTCVSPGDPSPIVYAIDELEPVRPDLTGPPDAAFGVLGLDRKAVWHRDPAGLALLREAAPRPVSRGSLAAAYGDPLVSDLVDRGWLQRPEELCREYLLTTAQIEVTADCNWGCGFCPVPVHRKSPATMTMDLFEEIVAKASVYDTLRYVTFHFYNEPTLDRFFEARVSLLERYGLRLRLYSNASGLTGPKIDALARAGVLDHLLVNIPTVDPVEFQELTRSRTYDKCLRNVEAAIDRGLPVTVVVNGTDGEIDRRVNDMRERFAGRRVRVSPTVLSDRAGEVGGPYYQAIRIQGPLRGCGWPVSHAHFSVTGDMFLCCNDYFQREVFGNIRTGSIHSLMTGDDAVRLRRLVFGVADAPADFLCRRCHDQLPDFPLRQFRPLGSFPMPVGSETRPEP